MRSFGVLVCWLLACDLLWSASPLVEFNVVPSSRAPLTAAQDWARALSKLDAVRVRSTRDTAVRPEIKRSDTSIRVTAIISASNQLLVPGKRFSLRQPSAIQAWIDQQRSGDASSPATDRFGLTTAQLQRVHEQLKLVVRFSTDGQVATDAVSRIARRVGCEIRLTRAHRLTLDGTSLRQDVEGLTAGTALAIVLRRAELAFVPRVNPAGKLHLEIADHQQLKEHWPVGWESQLKRVELVPKIFETLEIEVTQTPVSQLVAAVEARLATRCLFDEVRCVAAKIDPTQVRVTIPAGTMSYSRLLRHALFQAKMKSEIRIDERGKAFFWITPTK